MKCCTVYTAVLYTINYSANEHCSLQDLACSEQCTGVSVVYSVLCALNNIPCAVCSVQCAVCSVQCSKAGEDIFLLFRPD